MSFTLKEIMDQFNALEKTIGQVCRDQEDIRKFFMETQPRKIVFTGCGSSFSLSQSMRSIASTRLQIPVYAVAAGDLWLNCEAYAPLTDGALVISLSRSGWTSELINAVDAVKKVTPSARFLSILCAEETPIEAMSDLAVRLPWAFDRSVCQTRCVSNLYAAGALVIGAITGDENIERGFSRVAALGNQYLQNTLARAQALAKEPWDSAVVLGDGPFDGLAEEGALAFKEISQLPSNYYHLLDVRHGPIVLIGEKTLVLALVKSPACRHEQALIEDIQKKGARVIVYSNLPLTVPGAECFSLDEEVGPIAGGLGLVALCQMVSYFKALEVGCDPDSPVGLDPWIKLQVSDMTRDVLFAGELNVDLVLTGVRQAPVFGAEIIAGDYTECLGSSTAICACAAASLGLSTRFFGKLGVDRYGMVVMEAFYRYGIDTELIELSGAYKTGLTVSISAAHDRALVTCFGDTIDGFGAAEIPLETAGARHLHMGSYFLQPRVRKNLPAVYARAKQLGMTTSLDAGWDEEGRWNDGLQEILRFTDFFFPNDREACQIAGTDDIPEAATRIARMGANVMVKCGADGAILCERGSDEPRRFPPYQTRVLDLTGAGDSFNAGVLYAFLKGLPLDDCVRYGNAAGAVSVTRPGGTTACPTLREVEETIRTGRVM